MVRSRSCTRNIRNFVSVYGLGTKASLKNLFHKGAPVNFEAPRSPFSRGSKDFAAQGFILRRSLYRWIMHICLSGGSVLAFAVTFPLTFGWIHFEPIGMGETYLVHVFGLATRSFHIESLEALLMFNILNIAAILVLVGLSMATWRRVSDPGIKAVQTFMEDILPLLILFAVAGTGLMLTASYKFFAGQGHSIISLTHWVSVVTLLFYIPFGKLFHIVQRTCSLCVSVYQKEGESGSQAKCQTCGEKLCFHYACRRPQNSFKRTGF